MPKIVDRRLNTPSARAKLAPRRDPYYVQLALGIHLGYRRTSTGLGTWSVRCVKDGARWLKKLGDADDAEPADDVRILNFDQASDAARNLARHDGAAEVDASAPILVGAALDQYERDLETRGGDVGNAQRARYHIPTSLADRPVMLLTAAELRLWRDGLLKKKLAPATVNRTRSCLRAALELAALLDKRITNGSEFKKGLKGLPPGEDDDVKVLPDGDVLKIVDGGYQDSPDGGLLIDVLAETGARVSQAARVRCDGLLDDDMLSIPSSKKGGPGKNRPNALVPLSAELAARLRVARGNRPGNSPLLLKANGTRWQATDEGDYARYFAAAVANAGLEPITSYCLRHSAICRWLIAGVPVTLVAKRADTSVKIIEKHYARFIQQADHENRHRGVLQRSNVVALAA